MEHLDEGLARSERRRGERRRTAGGREDEQEQEGESGQAADLSFDVAFARCGAVPIYVGAYRKCQMTAAEHHDYTRRQRAAALGGRLRRLSERIDREAMEVYSGLGLAFEQRWFGLVNLLDRYGPLSVGELAEALGITHASVSQSRASLARAGHVRARPDAEDARSRRLELTASGRRLAARLRPVWDAMERVARALDAEAGGVVRVLERLEQALAEQSLGERVRVQLAGRATQPSGGASKVRSTGKNSGAGSAARVASKRFQVANPSSERGSRNRKTSRPRG